jgi:hypothetical protein
MLTRFAWWTREARQAAVLASRRDLPLGDGAITGHHKHIRVQFTHDGFRGAFAEVCLLLDPVTDTTDIVVHDGQSDAHAEDGHNAERDRSIGHEFVSLLSAIVLHVLVFVSSC